MANPKTLPPENMPQGMLWALLGSFFGSTVFIVSRFLLMNNAIDPISMSTIRFLGGLQLLFLFQFQSTAFINWSLALVTLYCGMCNRFGLFGLV